MTNLQFWSKVKVPILKTTPEIPPDWIYDPILNQSRKRYPWDRDYEYEQEEEEYTPFPISPKVFHFHPIAFVEQMRRMSTVYRKGDKGALILELNFRLSGFGGMLPTEEFTELTEEGVKQFQTDYMKITPTGEVDSKTLQKIDEFSDKYRENVANYSVATSSYMNSNNAKKIVTKKINGVNVKKKRWEWYEEELTNIKNKYNE
ncbi:hypothetical protein BZG02_15920 [Labilibaculum filiforme]|uniref:Peptidoglycan binding-like domain-containing protein n=1 Tax=Labilibaculum filiforme TaxID=1940526 RepID=A0A2N3HTS1_9BACT|nr:peptidoglycan-binding protein [Labilibaculum filiforme]PKQ61439.1 hypothetical protein BZG02_15920 [Labilibaculum filiforme]